MVSFYFSSNFFFLICFLLFLNFQADVQQKFDDRERRRKEVHDRLVQETKKKGFMTPERKKALKVTRVGKLKTSKNFEKLILDSLLQQLLRRKAAEEVKRLQEMKDKARREEISRRVGASKNIASLDECTAVRFSTSK